jgi:hypothetical protein
MYLDWLYIHKQDNSELLLVKLLDFDYTRMFMQSYILHM